MLYRMYFINSFKFVYSGLRGVIGVFVKFLSDNLELVLNVSAADTRYHVSYHS